MAERERGICIDYRAMPEVQDYSWDWRLEGVSPPAALAMLDVVRVRLARAIDEGYVQDLPVHEGARGLCVTVGEDGRPGLRLRALDGCGALEAVIEVQANVLAQWVGLARTGVEQAA